MKSIDQNIFFLSFLLLCQCWIVQMVEAQNIRYIPLNGTSHITNKTIDNRLPTGVIPAEASVDENGGASYVIPIYAAPGTNGVSPKIALAYNSMMGNGVLGQGWSISGLSSITRDGKSVHFDGKRTPVDLSSFDRFLLDGMRLSLRSGTYGANGSTYRKEVDDFAIVTAHGNMNGSPQYFKLEKKDGTIMEYGNSSDSRFLNQNGNEVLIWRLNRIWYRDGNYIQFVWTSTDRDNRISEIRYTGNTITGQSPYNLIRFHYKVRRDQNAIYEAGSNLESRYLLDRIEVTAENSTVKNYELYYSFDNYRSLLNTVNEKGSDGSALNTTIFKYGNQPTDFSSESLTAFTNSSTDVFSGDFNGDGYTDILTSPYSYSVDDSIQYNTSLRVYQRTATNSNYTLTTNINLPSESTVVNGMNVPKFHNFITSDFTGDGRDDIMTMKASISGSQNWRILEYMRLYESTGTSFSSSFVYPPAGFDRIPLNVRHFYPGDFNGDGITDYILFLSDAIGYKMFMTLGGTNVNNVEVSGLATLYLSGDWFNADDIRVIDFDGDGKMELLRVKDSKTKIYTFRENGNAISAHQLYDSGFPTKWHRLFFGDFNGDQKTDMLVRNSLNTNGGDWKTYLSTGKGFVSTPFTFTTTPDITGKENDDRLEIGDFNGDGKTDVLHSRTQNTSLRLDLYYSQGKTFRYESETYSDSLSTLPSLQCDLNGDGRTDLLAHTGASPFPVLMYFKKEGQELLLQNVVDGHLRRTNFTYRRMTQPSNFYLQSSFTSHPQNTVNMPLYLTYQLQQDNGIGGYFETRYRYEDAYVLRTGKGFLGFREFHSIDLTNDVRTEIHKNQDPTVYILAPHQVRRYVHSTGYLFNQINYSRSLIARPNKSYWLRIDGLTEHLYLQGQTKTSVYTYDNHGNIVREVANNGVETTITTSIFEQYGGPMPNRLTINTVDRQRTGQAAHIVTDRFYYNNKGQLTSMTKFYGTQRPLTTTYTYNNLGNNTTEAISAPGVSTRSTSKAYDAKGRFLLSSTNALGQSQTATYDNKWGKQLSVTGVNGLTTTFTYDAFGRRTTTTTPTSVVIVESYPFYANSGSTYYHRVSHPGRPDQWTYYDKLDRKVRHEKKAHANATIYQRWTFDSRGRLKTQRAPHKSGETTFTTTFYYDNYNRRTSMSNPFGTTTYAYSYASGISKVTKTDAAGQSSTVEMDVSERKTRATDNGGTLSYTHDSQGLVKQIKLGNVTMVSITNDLYGNKTQVVDKNAGTISYNYNAYGEMISQTNANGHTYHTQYNQLGQMTRRHGPGEDRRYLYYTTGAARNKARIIYNTLSIDREQFYYDSYGRMTQKLERIDGSYLSTQYTHNSFGDVTSKTFPSGLRLNYSYDANGILTSIKHLASNHTLFTNQAMNGRQQYTSYKLGNNKTTTVTYNQGVPTRYFASGVQDLYMNWNYANGNLNHRQDVIKGRIEYFTYDNLNRLTTAQVNGQPIKSVNYASNGNITSKTDVGNYSYLNGKINALARVGNTSNVIPTVTQDIVYNQFDQPSKVSEGNFELDYDYGVDRRRIKSVLKENGAVKTTRLYLGEFERQTKQGVTKDIHYVNAGQGTVAIVVKHNNAYQFYYTYTDHLGSILRVTNASGVTVAEQNFDPWGRKRNVSNWSYANVNAVPDWLYRGYTGHEDMAEFGLVNMNGRLYDPIVGRMLSVDNHIQSPTNTQSYNRYTYVFNNPLSYTDPNGELAWFFPVIIGAVVGAYAGASMASGGQWNFLKWDRENFWKGMIIGAFAGAAVGAMAAVVLPKVGVTITKIKVAGGSLSKSWTITTSALKGANVKMAATAMSGGDLDNIYRAGLVGAALGAYKGVYEVTKGFGLIDKMGWGAEVLNDVFYSAAQSIGGNWINGDRPFYNLVIGAGPIRFTFGKKYDNPVWRWQDNIGSLLPEAIALLGLIDGGELGVDFQKLTLTHQNGLIDRLFPEFSKLDKSAFFNGKDAISFIGQFASKLGSS